MEKVKDISKAKLIKGSIRNKLIAIILISIVAQLSVFGIFSYKAAFSLLNDKLAMTTQQTISETEKYVDQFLGVFEAEINSLEVNSSIQSYNPAAGDEALISVLESNPNIMNTYFGEANKQIHMFPLQDLPEGYDPTERGWYKDAMANPERSVWTAPYDDATTGKKIVTLAKAVKNDTGEIVGVLGIDIDISVLSDVISSTNIGRDGYIILSDADGIAMVHKNEKLVGTPLLEELGLWEKIESGNTGFLEYKYNEEDKFMSFATNERTGWKLAAAMEEAELLADTDILKKSTMASVAIGTIIAIIIALYIARMIAVPLNKGVSYIKTIAEGDFTDKVEDSYISRGDEFGELAKAVGMLQLNLRELLHNVRLSARTVSESASTLSDISNQSAEAADSVARTIEEISRGAESQATDTQRGSKNVEEIAIIIDKVSSESNSIKSASESANELTKKGFEIVSQLEQKSAESKNSTEEVNDIVTEVAKNAEGIGIIVETITAISSQTNLLALNANIEAARAGEHGKGFAVVAEEVRKLAEESSNSAEKIKEIIEVIQSKTALAVGAMDKAYAVVEEQSEAVEQTNSIFKEISESIDLLGQNANKIKKDSGEMIAAKDGIVVVVNNIASAAEESSAATEEVSAATEEQLASMQQLSSHSSDLEKLSGELLRAVEKFKID
ncbi:methyl-accepting chemotaxis protein McpA (plasmid) [Peptoclostridium acidaminophilum DSM 3953]|uniref:Methyl-accepting chemotaxis protein McpA n=1 Tax=Peptoclostridium acidaminophilum DSM 3953 TaxID=1286171 RepID=W8TPX6_PEPAC|nr:methyl-accepting chemotaxis protein [Peptoclostridium acidaminophilum]AHM58147.1 methyl-accepting chemotaxis protein McpA [Peptoclostridium acidaminophilum DSM 3953]